MLHILEICPLVPVKKNLKESYYTCSWPPFGSSDQHHINEFSFPRILKLTNKTWLKMAQLFFFENSILKYLYVNDLGPRSKTDISSLTQLSASFRSQAAIVSEKAPFFTYSYRRA